MNRSISTLFLLLFTLTFVSCTGFQREWKAAKAAPYQGIEGPWEGTWTSGVNQHHGKLRCIVTKVNDTEYEYHYWASWAGFLSGSFRTTHQAALQPDGKSYALSGKKDLGALGGVHEFTGSTDDKELKADFTSAGGDSGVFELKRLPVAAE